MLWHFDAAPKQHNKGVFGHILKSSSAMVMLGARHVPKIFGYRVQREGKWWGIYWITESSTLCTTDFGSEFFELRNLERKDRKKLLKNVAESLVEARWK